MFKKFRLPVFMKFFSVKTELDTAKRVGLDMLTLRCRFDVDPGRFQRLGRKVNWLLNGESVEGYPHFKVTSHYYRNRELLDGRLKIVRPEILADSGNMFTCEYDDVVHNWYDTEGKIWIFYFYFQ